MGAESYTGEGYWGHVILNPASSPDSSYDKPSRRIFLCCGYGNQRLLFYWRKCVRASPIMACYSPKFNKPVLHVRYLFVALSINK